jgi:predicted RNA-binding Zn ribbon-like protein
VVSSKSGEIDVRREGKLLIDFVNTRDVEQGTDAIGDPEALSAWVSHSAAGIDSGPVDAAGHRRILGLRESLRALMRANNGGEASGGDLTPLREAAGDARYRTSIDVAGALRIEPEGAGLEAFEGRLLLAVERLQALGGWGRLKVCPADECQWAFFDSSRNHSRHWCSMDVCGNRSKTRRYRSRRSSR